MKKLILALLLAAAAPAFATLYDTTGGRITRTGNGATTVYAFTFPAGAASDVSAVVTLAGVAQAGTYSVSLNSDQINSPGGTVTFTAAPANSTTITIQRTELLQQKTIYSPYSAFPAKTTERTFDATVRQVQQVNRRVADLETKEASDISNTIAGGIAAANLLSPVGTGTTTGITLADWYATAYDIREFGASTLSGDNQPAIQAAVTAACAAHKAVYIPAGTWNVGSTVTACGRIRIFGDGDFSVLNPTISNGSPVLKFPPGSQFFRVENLMIAHTLASGPNFDNGSEAAQQCTAIQVASTTPSGPFSARFSLSNIHVQGVKVAYDITGFIVTVENLWAQYNEIGFKGSYLNSADLNLRLEDNIQSFSIDTSSAVLFRQLLTEGANCLGVAATVNSTNSVTFLNPHFEEGCPRTQSALSVGASTRVYGLKIVNGHVVGSGSFTAGVDPIKLDQVTGVEISGDFSLGGQLHSIGTTVNTLDYKLSGEILGAGGFLQDGSNQINTAFNYWPNRRFDAWLRGWNQGLSGGVVALNATLAKETTITRSGANALRITTNAGTNFNGVQFRIVGDAVTALRGKSVTVGAWVWVPNLSAFDESSRVLFPGIILQSYDGATTINSASANTFLAKNAWNFVTANLTIQAGATQILLAVYANQSATNGTGAEYVILGSTVLTDAATSFTRLINDSLIDSPLIPAIGVGGRMILTGAAAPTDAVQTFVAGDVVMSTAPVAGGSPGWVCTTGGSPGTWKAMANVAP